VAVHTVHERAPWKAVAIPSEHGGWGLTLEPVLLGLLVAPSIAGALLGLAAFLAFLVRTPLKLVLVDIHRDRWLSRTRLAATIATAEGAAIVALAVIATALAGWSFWISVAIAAPLVAIELWFDARSRGRRLAPELCGTIGVCSIVAAIVLAAGEPAALAAALWVVLAARAIGAISFVRMQIVRLRRGDTDRTATDLAQAAAVAVGTIAVILDTSTWVGFLGLVAMSVLHVVQLRRPPVPAKTLGLRQMALGLALVVATAIGVNA
jgi:hypothetical protein